jgi:hypothetical protein
MRKGTPLANPRPDLQGFADPTTNPNWREDAIARVRSRQAKTRRHNERTNGLWLFFDDELRVLLDEACKRRNISLTGYARRALIGFIAYDLGLKYEEVAQHGAEPVPYGATGGGRNKRTHDHGRGMGPWKITGLRELKW